MLSCCYKFQKTICSKLCFIINVPPSTGYFAMGPKLFCSCIWIILQVWRVNLETSKLYKKNQEIIDRLTKCFHKLFLQFFFSQFFFHKLFYKVNEIHITLYFFWFSKLKKSLVGPKSVGPIKFIFQLLINEKHSWKNVVSQ